MTLVEEIIILFILCASCEQVSASAAPALLREGGCAAVSTSPDGQLAVPRGSVRQCPSWCCTGSGALQLQAGDESRAGAGHSVAGADGWISAAPSALIRLRLSMLRLTQALKLSQRLVEFPIRVILFRASRAARSQAGFGTVLRSHSPAGWWLFCRDTTGVATASRTGAPAPRGGPGATSAVPPSCAAPTAHATLLSHLAQPLTSAEPGVSCSPSQRHLREPRHCRHSQAREPAAPAWSASQTGRA